MQKIYILYVLIQYVLLVLLSPTTERPRILSKEEAKETLQVIDGSPDTSENKTQDSDQAGKNGDALIAHIAEEWHNYFASVTYEFAVDFYEETISYSKSVLS